MRKSLVYATTLILAFALGLGLVGVLPHDAQAKRPVQCKLAIEPFLDCVDHPSCKGDAQRCWECLGVTPGGEPCLCTLVGCMVP